MELIAGNSAWFQLGKKQAELFDNDNIAYMNCLISNPSMRTVMNNVYRSLVGYKIVVPIEELEQSQKIDLWEATKEFASGKLNNAQLIDFSKSLYALNYFCGL